MSLKFLRFAQVTTIVILFCKFLPRDFDFFFLVRIGIRIDKGTLDFRRNTNRQWYVENSNQTTRPFGCFLVSGWIENHFAFRAKSKMLSRCCFALSYTTYRIIIIMSVNGRDTKTSCIRSNANEICIRNGFYQHFFFFLYLSGMFGYMCSCHSLLTFSRVVEFSLFRLPSMFFSLFLHDSRIRNVVLIYLCHIGLWRKCSHHVALTSDDDPLPLL